MARDEVFIEVSQEDHYYVTTISEGAISVSVRGNTPVEAINLAYQTLNNAKQAHNVIVNGPGQGIDKETSNEF